MVIFGGSAVSNMDTAFRAFLAQQTNPSITTPSPPDKDEHAAWVQLYFLRRVYRRAVENYERACTIVQINAEARIAT